VTILVITNYYPPYFLGGYELACKESCDYLISKGHTIYIVCGDYQKESKTTIKPNKPYRKLKYIDYKNSSFIQKNYVEKYNYKVVKDIIESIDFDLVYIWNQKSISTAPTIAVQDSRVRHIFEIGDFWMDAYYRNGFMARANRFLKRILPFTVGGYIDFNPIITVSNWVADEMRDRYNSKDIYIIPNGIDIDSYKDVEKKPIDSKVVKIMYAGRVERSKGLDILIKAISQYNQKDNSKEIFLSIYGREDEVYLNECKELAKNLLKKDSFKFYGHQNGIAHLFENNDIFVMPFRATETFGLVVIESMLHMTPVIATNAYGPAEIIENGVNGVLFEMENSQDLANKIELLIEDSKLFDSIQDRGY
jgi:glycosyltransferase involved in cell wall biosynthesis